MDIMKGIKKSSIYIIICAVILPVLIIMCSISARGEEAPLVTLESQRDITIIVSYDREKPRVAFISPSGTRYENPEDFNQVVEGDNCTYYNIARAERGDWIIDYEKGANREVTVDVLNWHMPITANSLTFQEVQSEENELQNIEGYINVTYERHSYEYIISAAVKDSSGNIINMIEMYKGSGNPGSDTEFSIYPDMLPDGEYYLVAEVYAEDDSGTEVRDSIEASGVFTISGNTSEGDADCLDVLCNLTDNYIDINFSVEGKNFSCEEYALIVMQDKLDDYLSLQSYEGDGFADHIIFDPEDGNIVVQVNARLSDGGYMSWTRTITHVMPANVTIETQEISNDLNAVISFDAGDETYYGNLILGDASEQLRLTGSSKIQVGLEAMNVNELEFQVDSNDVTYCITGRVSVDNMPPLLDIYGASDSMTTKEKTVVFVGCTEPGAALNCNGDSISPEADGSFTITLELADGENEFRFESVDDAGNSTVRIIHIIKTDAGKTVSAEKDNGIMTVLTAIGGAVLITALIGLIAGAVISRREKKGMKKNAFGAVLLSFFSILAVLFTGLGVLQLIMHFIRDGEISGDNLINLLQSASTSEIADIIREQRAYLYSSFISFGAALIIIIALIIYAIIRRSKRKNRNNGDMNSRDMNNN